MKILVFAGSTRQHSFNRQLARQAAAMATAAGAEAMQLELGDLDIPMYNADLEARGTPLDVLCLKQLLWEHPAWIICSPEYNGSYPALLKNALDWASSPVADDATWSDGTLPFRGKVVGMLSASNGQPGRAALAKPSGAAAAEPRMLAGTARVCAQRCGQCV